jgi:hypothetical protein
MLRLQRGMMITHLSLFDSWRKSAIDIPLTVFFLYFMILFNILQRGGVWGVQSPPSQTSKVLTNLSQIASSMESTSVTT